MRCKLYIPGSLHMFNGIVDKLSLSESGKRYLIERGVPAEDIYGDDKNIKYRGKHGVYNAADECYVASMIWHDEKFSELLCVCSPVQSMRKAILYIADGVLASIFTCPSVEMFHDYVYEMFNTLPYIMYKDPYLKPEESAVAKEYREQRKPDIYDMQENSRKIEN